MANTAAETAPTSTTEQSTDAGLLAAFAAATEQHRLQQAALRATVVKDVISLWNSFSHTGSIDAPWSSIKQTLSALVQDRRSTSSGLAAAHYRNLRTIAGVEDTYRSVMAGRVPDALLDATEDATGVASYFRAIGNGLTPQKADENAQVLLSGSLSRLAVNGGRETIRSTSKADSQAVAWIRITDGDPCYFCAMLASRGAVYKSAGTAGGDQNDRFTGDGAFKFHDHCGCMADPVFRNVRHPAEDKSEALYQRWLDVQKNKKRGDDSLNEWRRQWNSNG